MSELRWNPLLRQWVVVAAHRQGRPQMPEDWCPFCPGSGQVPDDYDVLLYPNDFAALEMTAEPFRPDAPRTDPTGIFQATGARGACDVVLYHPDHHLLPSELPVPHWRKVIDLWAGRTAELAAVEGTRYVFVFENTGAAIGVTMPHPHGQIYAFPFLPPLIQTEFESAAEHHSRMGECLYCHILAAERQAGARIVAANHSFVAFCPFFARWPTEVQIYSTRHFASLTDLAPAEADDLAAMISLIRRKYDNLYDEPVPLMMLVRQGPAKGPAPWFHFHIEFCPVQRSATKLKFLAAVESGSGTFLNDTQAEEQAEILRRTEPVEAGV
ncbi:MAG: galactose-1-phosphate uridylyltransferase [Bryobacteraceae bacterium]